MPYYCMNIQCKSNKTKVNHLSMSYVGALVEPSKNDRGFVEPHPSCPFCKYALFFQKNDLVKSGAHRIFANRKVEKK